LIRVDLSRLIFGKQQSLGTDPPALSGPACGQKSSKDQRKIY
jgi:hypothetical protein